MKSLLQTFPFRSRYFYKYFSHTFPEILTISIAILLKILGVLTLLVSSIIIIFGLLGIYGRIKGAEKNPKQI